MRLRAWSRAAILLMIVSTPFFSQTTADNNAHAWLMFFGDHPFSERWGVHLEGQARRATYSTSWQQYLLRPGVNYKFSPNVMGTVGYAFAYSYPYGDYRSTVRNFPEHRYFEQLLLRNSIGKVAFQHRLRAEQRTVQTYRSGQTPAQNWELRHRFRYMLRADIPLPNKRFYLGIYDELFINYGANRAGRYLDQNRAYAAFGIKVSQFEKLELGYMHQYVPQRNGRIVEHNHTAQIALFSSRPIRFSSER